MAACTLNLIAHSIGRRVEDIQLDKSFVENGGHSLAAFTVSSGLRKNNIELTTAEILSTDCLSNIITRSQRHAEYRAKITAVPIMETPANSDICPVPDPVKTIRTSQFERHTPFFTEQEQVSRAKRQRSHVPCTHECCHTSDRSMGHLYPVAETGQKFTADIHKSSDDDSNPFDNNLATATITGSDANDVAEQPTPALTQAKGLTQMQLRLLHGSLKTPGANIIHYSETYRAMYLPLLRMAWRRVINLEPIFATRFPDCYTEGQQIPFEWKERVAHDDQQYRFLIKQAFQETRIGCCFSVITRAKKRGKSVTTIVWSVHHSFIDGFSLKLLVQKVRKAARGIPLQPGSSFEDFARTLQRYRLQNQTDGQHIWIDGGKRFAVGSGRLNLPEPLNVNRLTALSDEVRLDFQDLLPEIKQSARISGVTLAAMFYAAWALVLARLTDSHLVVFSSIFAGRDLPLPGIESVIGPILNTLPFVVEIDGGRPAREYVQSVFQQLIELSDVQWKIPDITPRSDIESALAMQFDSHMRDDEAEMIPLQKPETSQMADVPLSVAIYEDGDVHLRYHTRRFIRSHIQRVGDMFRQAIGSLCCLERSIKTCDASMLSIPHLSMLKQWGNTMSGLSTEASVSDDLVTLFERTARRLPEAIAAEQGHSNITYSQLDSRSSQVAANLRPLIEPGEVVFVHADRSIAWLIAIYGVLKAGAVYCPLEPSLPTSLKTHMFKVTGAKVFVSRTRDQETSAPSSCSSFLVVDKLTRGSSSIGIAGNLPRSTPLPEHPAYVCFTSGSSGVPKGVVCTHQGLVAFQLDVQVRLFAQPGKRVAQLMSPAFDGSIHEIFSSLSYGATLVLNSETSEIFENLKDVDSCILTPSMARVLDPRSYPKLKQVYLVGEAVPQPLSDLWSQHVDLYNMYGPTEATCGATIKRLESHVPVLIGRPNPTTRLYVMDSNQRLVMPGAIGEICLAGVQVATGYLGMPELSEVRFVPDSVCRIGEQMYRTGDKGYWNDDGEIVLLGRSDREVKLRGYRLDLDDLEIRISNVYPKVSGIAVLKENDNLVAVVEPAHIDIDDLRHKITTVLPGYAVPSRVIAVERLPTTIAGKTDYHSLQSMSPSPKTPKWCLEDPTQRMVAEKMLSVLHLDHLPPISPETNFRELGGTSLDHVSLASQISEEAGSRISLKLIVEQPQVAAIAQAIDQVQETGCLSPGKGPRLGEHRASPIETDWFEKYKLGPGVSAFNVVYAANFDAELVERRALVRAWNAVLQRHRILRSRFARSTEGEVVRSFHEQPPQVHETEHIPIEMSVNRVFDISSDKLIDVVVGSQGMLVVVSHIIADFTTLAVLLEEAATVYHGTSLPPPNSYADTTVWNEESPLFVAKWWVEYLDAMPEQPAALMPQQKRRSYQGSSLATKLPSDLWVKMQKFASSSGISLQQLTLAAVGIAIGDQEDKMDIILGVPFINRRSEPDFSTVGLFLQPLPVRITYVNIKETSCTLETTSEHDSLNSQTPSVSQSSCQDSSAARYLSVVQKSCQDALAHAMPWHYLLRQLAIEPSWPSHPLFDVMVSFHEESQLKKISGTDIDGMHPRLVWSKGSKFKLMVEVVAVDAETLVLRLEYDNDIFSINQVRTIANKIVVALQELTCESDFSDIVSRVNSVGVSDEYYEQSPVLQLGAQLDSL